MGRLDVVAHRGSEVWKRSAHERDVGWRESGADTVSWDEERASSDGSRDEVEIHAGLDVVAGAHVEDLSVEVDGDATALVKISEGVVARRVRNLAVVGAVEPREGTTEVVVGDRERLHAQGDGRHGVHACIIEVCRRLVGREREVLDDDGGDVVEFVDVKSRTTREEGGGRVQHVVVPGGVAADVVSNQAGRRGELALVVEAGAGGHHLEVGGLTGGERWESAKRDAEAVRAGRADVKGLSPSLAQGALHGDLDGVHGRRVVHVDLVGDFGRRGDVFRAFQLDVA